MDHNTDHPPSDALELLIRTHGAVVMAHAVRLTGGDRSAAEDVAQETFIRAWRHLERMTDEYGSVRSWLLRVAHNIAVDTHRRRKAEPVPDIEIEISLGTGDDAAERLLSAMVATDALSTLDDAHRAVLVGVYLHGQTMADVARQLDVPVGTVKSRVFYALRRLRELLNEPVACTG